MKRICFWTLPLLLLLGACKDQDEPKAHVAGSILAGEVGAGIRSVTFPSGVQINGASISGNHYEVILDSSLDKAVVFNSTEFAGSSSGISYNHMTCSVRASNLAIELAAVEMNDTLWKCEEWNVDSTEQHLYYFNRAAGTFCQNSATVEAVVLVLHPIAYVAGDSLHGGLDWRSDALDIAFYHSDYAVTSDGQRTYINDNKRRYDDWLGIGQQYIGFRLKAAGGIWKYGYVLMEAKGHSSAKIYGFGVEG